MSLFIYCMKKKHFVYTLLVPQVKHFNEERLYLARVDFHEELVKMYVFFAAVFSTLM